MTLTKIPRRVRRQVGRKGIRSYRPQWDLFEDRTLLSSIMWTGNGGDNNWDTAANWSSDALPTASDDVVIDNSFAGTTITHSSSSSDSVNSLNSQAAIDISGGALSISGASTSNDPSGASTINNGLTVASTLTVSGDLTVNGSFTWTGGSTLDGSGTLDAYGGMAMNNLSGTLDGLTLNNHATAIWTGGGDIAFGNNALFHNLAGASFDAQTDGTIGDLAPTGWGSGSFQNDGTFTKSAGTGTTEIHVPFNNTGSASVSSGTLALKRGGTSTGSFTGSAGTTLEFDGHHNLSGAISGDTIQFENNFIDPFPTTTISGSYSASTATILNDGPTVQFTGPVSSVGNYLDVDYQATADFSPATPVTLTVTTLTVRSVLTGTDSFVVDGPFNWNYGGQLIGGGTIDAEGGINIGSGGLLLYGYTLNNHATATWTGGGTIAFDNNAMFNNLAGANFDAQCDGQLGRGSASSYGNGAINNAGSFTKSAGTGTTEVDVPFNNTGSASVSSGTLSLAAGGSNTGSMTVAAGATLSAAGYIQSGGSTSLNSGTLTGGPFNINSGILSGSGTVNANLSNGGQVIPGGTGSAGLLIINGNYTQTASGALNVELGGTTAGSQYARVTVSGTASLGGTLNVIVVNNFHPAVGNTFQILTFGSSSGNFTTYNGLSLGGGVFLDPVFNASSLTLQADQVAISGAPAFPLEGIPITLTGSVTGPSVGNPSVFTFSWTVTQNGNAYQSGSGSTFTFTPNVNATYLVTLAVADASGGNGAATAQVIVAPSIFVLNPTASGALTLSGNASIKIPGAVVVDSSSSTALSASGNAQLTASIIDVAGGSKKTGNATFSPAPTTGVSVPDPLASLASPSTIGLTNRGSESLSGNSTATIAPGIYSQITVSGNASLTLGSGIYIIEGGGLTVTGNASVAGTGVIIYNAGSNFPNSGGTFGGITLSGNGTFSLTAPTTGTYAGVLIFQSHEHTRALSFSGNALAGMTGTISAPAALLSMSGTSSLQSSLDVGMLNLSGNVALTQTAAGSDGTGDTSGIANTLLAGNLSVYINDPSGYFTSDELSRIQDAINAWDTILAP